MPFALFLVKTVKTIVFLRSLDSSDVDVGLQWLLFNATNNKPYAVCFKLSERQTEIPVTFTSSQHAAPTHL